MPSPEDIPEAIRINDLHLADKDDELLYKGIMLTTVVSEARSSRFKEGTAELIIEESKKILKELETLK